MKKFWFSLAVVSAVSFGGIGLLTARGQEGKAAKQQVYELRTYTAAPGKMDALNKRFHDHSDRILRKHGMNAVGYWTPTDPERSKDTIVYILAHPDVETAKAHWKEFLADPEWKKVAAESEKDGKLTTKVESVFMNPTDYSPVK